MLNLDPNSEFGARVLRRLQDEEIAWLTTVTPSGAPRPVPVWFIWEKGTIRIYSQPTAAKVRYLEHQPRVSLNLNSNRDGGDIIILTGEARVAPDEPRAADNAAYVTKYTTAIARLGYDAQGMSDTFSMPIIFTPEHVSGH